MKKKLFTALAVTLACATMSLSACTSGDSKITFGNYWNYDTRGTSNEKIEEHFEYDVSFTPYDSAFINYDLNYTGTYTVDMKSNGDDTYTVSSFLDVGVDFILSEENKAHEADYVYSTVTFHKAGGSKNMRPISSKKVIVSHSPVNNSNAKKPEDCYALYVYEIETLYEGKKGICTRTEYFGEDAPSIEEDGKGWYKFAEGSYSETTTKKFSAKSSKNSVLDNEQFPIAFRALPSNTNAKVKMFNPFLMDNQTYAVSLAKKTSEKKFEGFTFKYDIGNGEGVKTLEDFTFEYRTASIVVNGAASGQAQTAEVAALFADSTNVYFNIVLSYNTPLAYNMGVINYKIKNAVHKTIG